MTEVAAGRPAPRPVRAVRASVVIVAYDAGSRLVRCVQSLAADEEPPEVVIVNTGRLGPELEEAERFPFVRLVDPGANLGYSAGSNLGVEHTSGDVLVFLNPDTVAAPGAVAALARTVVGDPQIGVAMARLRLHDRPDLLNSAGNVVHVSGLAWVGGHGTPAEALTSQTEVPYASGAALAIRAELFRELGGFAEELFMYHEDLELCWRVRLRGLRVVVEPAADVFHDYEFGRNPRKQYLLERNRLVFVLSAYSTRLLVLLAPVLVGTELAVSALAIREGWLREKAAGWGWCVRNAGWMRRRRRELQRLRAVPDRELAEHLTPLVDPAVVAVPAVVRAANPLLSAYWRLVRRAL